MSYMRDAHTDTRPPHSLRPVATWTGAVVAASGILTDLIVSALMSSISALVDVYSRPHRREKLITVHTKFQLQQKLSGLSRNT